jgi:hypothetical protein
MNIIKTIDQYNDNYVFFCDPIKNNIMNNGNFIRIIYSTPLVVLNGIYILVNIGHVFVEKYYNKLKCSFDLNQSKHMIEHLRIIEEKLLKRANIADKTPKYKIYEQLCSGNIKVFAETIDKNINSTFLLKIAGIWEADAEYGLTYKFISV